MIELGEFDWTADTEAELIAFEVGERSAVLVSEKRIGVKVGVAEEFVEASVELVGAGLIDEVDDAAAAASEFGGVGIGLDLELLDGIDRREDGDTDDGIGKIGCGRNSVD